MKYVYRIGNIGIGFFWLHQYQISVNTKKTHISTPLVMMGLVTSERLDRKVQIVHSQFFQAWLCHCVFVAAKAVLTASLLSA